MEQYLSKESYAEYADFQNKYKKAEKIIIYHSNLTSYECDIRYHEQQVVIVTNEIDMITLVELLMPSVKLLLYGFVGDQQFTKMSSFDNHDFVAVENCLLTRDVLVELINAGRFRYLLIRPEDGFDSTVDYSRTKCTFRIPEHESFQEYPPIVINAHKLDIRTIEYDSLVNVLKKIDGCKANQLTIKCQLCKITYTQMNKIIRLFNKLNFETMKLHMILDTSKINLEGLILIDKFKSITIIHENSVINCKSDLFDEGKLKKLILVKKLGRRCIINYPHIEFVGQKYKCCV